MGILSSFSLLIVLMALPLYHSIRAGHQWKVLLGASLIYLACCSVLGFASVIASALLSYFCAKAMSRTEDPVKRKTILISEVIFYIVSWVIIKNIIGLSGDKVLLISTLHISETALALGCSYFVLRYISYSFDVYKGKLVPERDFFKLLLYYCYFPAILQGPIERYGLFSSRSFPEQKKKITYENIRTAALLILHGMFKVYVISRFCAKFSYYLNDPEGINAFILLAGIFLYSIQLYADFSGGIDIVRGISYLFGVESSENFCRPYLSRSISEFWRRWHITFSGWLRDYIYIPLGGNRKGKTRALVNQVIVFIVSAVWHGFGLTFLIWGCLHALFILTEKRFCKNLTDRTPPGQIPLAKYLLGSAKVFLLATFSWIFFNAASMESLVTLFSSMASSIGLIARSGIGAFVSDLASCYISEIALPMAAFLIYAMSIVISIVLQILKDRKGFEITDPKQVCTAVRWVYYFALIAILMSMGFYGSTFNLDSFIYGAF